MTFVSVPAGCEPVPEAYIVVATVPPAAVAVVVVIFAAVATFVVVVIVAVSVAGSSVVVSGLVGIVGFVTAYAASETLGRFQHSFRWSLVNQW